MKKQLKKWGLRLLATLLFFTTLLLIIILHPTLVYAKKTIYKNYIILHNKPFDKKLFTRLDEAQKLTAKSELFNPQLHLDVCLNDGSVYPLIIEQIFGKAFAWGFYNKVVLKGFADFDKNFVKLNGYKWNLSQILAHEAIHCHQFDKLGLWRSNPVANIPVWKWEGYPEYIARGNDDQSNLKKNIEHLIITEQHDTNGWIKFSDSTGSSMRYYKNRLLVQYCITIKLMTYDDVLKDKTAFNSLYREMMVWYNNQK